MIPWRVKNFWQRHLYERFHADYRDIYVEGGMASFTFDDFPASAYEIAGPLLVEKGWRGTYYTAAGLTGATGEMGPLHSSEIVARCHHEGHEIADHSFSHVDCTQIGPKSLIRECEQNKEQLSSYVLTNFAFPFGAHDYQSATTLAPHFRSLRTVTPGLNGKKTDLKRLNANAVYEQRPLDDIYQLIERAHAEGSWIIFYTHDVSQTPSDFGCSPATLQTVLSAIDRKGMTVGTVEQCLDRIA